jgi:hypothetical protein
MHALGLGEPQSCQSLRGLCDEHAHEGHEGKPSLETAVIPETHSTEFQIFTRFQLLPK